MRLWRSSLLWMVVAIHLCIQEGSARALRGAVDKQTQVHELQAEAWEGTLEVLAVDYMPPREPETWYSLRLEPAACRLSLDMTAVEENGELHGLYSGLRVRIAGRKQADNKVLVSHVQLLDTPAHGVTSGNSS